MKVFEYKGYRKSLVALRRRGGPFQKAAEKAIVMQDDLRDAKLRAKLPVTNHGECRIKKAVKYDLGAGACRLVTVQDAGFIFVCFAGTHDEADKWLDANRGLTIRVGGDSKPLASFESVDIAEPDQRLKRDMGFTNKPLLSLLEERLQDVLLQGLNWRLAKELADSEVFITDDEVEQLVEQIEDAEQKLAIFDVLVELRADNVSGATTRARAYAGELQTVQQVVDVSNDLVDSTDFRHIDIDSEHYRQLIEHFARSADFKDWMLFMHPDQQKFVDANYAGPAKLSGVSGSGKTCVVVKRAVSLANRYTGEDILILTLNRSLAVLIDALVGTTADEKIRNQIKVRPFFTLCQELLHSFEPDADRLYDDVTWKMKEHIDEIWSEYYRCELNNHGARVLQRVHDRLIARGINAEQYIREEFDWIRSATPPDQRDLYLTMERVGRTYPLDEKARKQLLEGLGHWEEKMRFVGVTDYLGVANALARHADKLQPTFRCVLIDESQDFGTTELGLIRRLVKEGENDLFLCGDAAQQVSSKHQNLTEADMPVPGARSFKLELNYRNSREILEVAYEMLVDNLSEQMLAARDFEVLDPQYASFGGPNPLLLEAEDLASELGSALAYARAEATQNEAARICIAVCGYSERELESFAARVGLPLLNGETDLEAGQILLSDLENTKGFEFQCIIIANCSAGVIPNPHAPEEEAFRDLSRLYVAMTRARQQLVLGFCGQPTRLIDNQLHRFQTYSWRDYVDEAPSIAPPQRLEELRHGLGRDVRDMTGAEYLYQESAIGCPAILIEKLRSAVSGQSRTVNSTAVEWKTIGQALKDTKHNVRSRQVFGPEGYRMFRERLAELG